MLKQDLEKEDADEQVEPGCAADLVSAARSVARGTRTGRQFDVVVVVETFAFLAFPLEVKRELRKLASFAPGEIGCLAFFSSP